MKEKVTPFLTKFRRIIGSLKRPPSRREQLNLAFSDLRPEYQDYLWDKTLDSFEALERYGREFERKEAIKERYRAPLRREKSRIPGTTYDGPRGALYQVVAVVESTEEVEKNGVKRRRVKKKLEKEQP